MSARSRARQSAHAPAGQADVQASCCRFLPPTTPAGAHRPASVVETSAQRTNAPAGPHAESTCGRQSDGTAQETETSRASRATRACKQDNRAPRRAWLSPCGSGTRRCRRAISGTPRRRVVPTDAQHGPCAHSHLDAWRDEEGRHALLLEGQGVHGQHARLHKAARHKERQRRQHREEDALPGGDLLLRRLRRRCRRGRRRRSARWALLQGAALLRRRLRADDGGGGGGGWRRRRRHLQRGNAAGRLLRAVSRP